MGVERQVEAIELQAVVSPQESNEHCMALMTEHRLRHLVVLDGGNLVGVLSMRDLVRDIISEQKFVIEQLQHYISGSNR